MLPPFINTQIKFLYLFVILSKKKIFKKNNNNCVLCHAEEHFLYSEYCGNGIGDTRRPQINLLQDNIVFFLFCL